MTPLTARWMGLLWVFLVSASSAIGQEGKSPLRFVASQSELVIQVDRPRHLIEAVEKHELFQQAQKLAGVREYYDTTTFQQVYQLIGYFEKQLGKGRDDIIDDLTDGGVVLGAKLTPPQSTVLVLQSKDEKKLRRFMDLALDVLEKELERQESKDKIVRPKYRIYDTGRIGPKVSFAIADGALVIATEEKVLKAALDLQLNKKESASVLSVPGFAEAHKKAPAKALAWAWINLEEARKNPGFKNGLDAAALDNLQVVLFGGLTNLLQRSPYVTAALTREGSDFRLGISMPRGREGMSALKHMILAPDGGGALPPLMPPRTISSSSYFLDLGQLWDKRVEILGKQNAQGLEQGDKALAQVLGTIKLAKLFKSAGPNHRLVVAQQKESPYKLKPAAPVPAFALVVDMRDPSFAKDMNGILRSAALASTFAFGLQLKEESYKDCEMISYYLSETKKVDVDQQKIRFNFSPTYVTVGDNFVVSSTAELARDLIDVLKTEQKQKPMRASTRTNLHASGLAAIIRSNEETTLTQLILAQALPPKTAKAELEAIVNWIEQLGTLRLETNYGANDFRYDILWQAKKK